MCEPCLTPPKYRQMGCLESLDWPVMKLCWLMGLYIYFSVATPPDLQEWTNRAQTFDNLTNSVSIFGIYCFQFGANLLM